MPPGVSLQSNFTAGELSPAMLGRVEMDKFRDGARTMRNFLVQSHGPAVKRPGFVLLGQLPGQAVLLEFVFNNDQTYALIFGDYWLRVAMHGGFVLDGNGNPYQIASPYSLEQAKQLSFVQSADVLFIACQGVRPQKLKRLGHANWQFEGMTFTEPLPAPEWGSDVVESTAYELAYPANTVYYVKGSGWTSRYELVTYDLYRKLDPNLVTPNYVLAFAKDTAYIQDGYEPNSDDPIYTPIGIALYRMMATDVSIWFVNGAVKSDGSKSEAQLVTPYTYYITAVNSDGKEGSMSIGANITGPSQNNWQGGDYIGMNWLPVAGAEEYRVYKAAFGGRGGYVATTGNTSWQDNNTAASASEGAPKYVDPFPDGDYPGTVCLFEQRLVFASSPKRQQTIWMSKTGDYGNFATYTPVADDSPIELTIASQEVSAANWMIPLRSLIFGTPGMEWEISGSGDSAFTAKTAKATPQSYWGSSLKRAMIIGNVILHVSSSGSQVRNLQYDFTSDSYGGSDLSILAAHLLERQTIVDWAYAKNPDSIIWAVRSDGVLLGLTFQAEHKLAAWHRHDTQGKFLSVCSVPHGKEHDLFAVIERGGVYYLERMGERYLGGDPSRAVFLDCASTYEGAAAQVIYGLGHLEGKTVGIFSRGAVEAPRVVSNGSVTLEAPSTLVTVGLPYTADLETMPVEVVAQNGASVALKKQINSINILFFESLGVKVGLTLVPGDLDAVKWQDVKWRTKEDEYGVPPAPFTGIKHLTMPNGAENSLSVCVRSELPTPVTVQAIMSRIEVKA